ncbi:hypothetical protein [Pseudoalteromonas sp.]|uniref:hypothetical protein n=1 Tax=Pseudoalteromonas sp. TaxID=53249 RepID=UPI00300386B7
MSNKNNHFAAVKYTHNELLYNCEQPIAYAPIVQLSNASWVVPQHFLRYQHTLESVNKTLDNIEFSTHFRVLAAKQNEQIYLQVAILSPDNYRSTKAKKLLFGRRWFVEENLPTSELIQTAFLALKIAREHEVRELFQLESEHGSSTPFNNHHDLPLLAQNPQLTKVADNQPQSIKKKLARCSFAQASITLIAQQKITDEQMLYTLRLNCLDCQLSEFNEKTVTFLAADASENTFLHALMSALIANSNDYVSEQFKYAGYARFSKKICAEQIGTLSIVLRSQQALQLCALGKQHASQLNFEIDSSRAPQGCGQAISGFLAAHGIEKPENAHLYTDYLQAL